MDAVRLELGVVEGRDEEEVRGLVTAEHLRELDQNLSKAIQIPDWASAVHRGCQKPRTLRELLAKRLENFLNLRK